MAAIRKILACAILACAFSVLLSAQETEGRLLLFPDIHNDKVAFVYGGDIWLASSCGRSGPASYLESRPRVVPQVFSGRKVAGIHRTV